MRRMKLIAFLFGALALLGSCAANEDPAVTEPEDITEATDEPAADAEGDIRVSSTDLGNILTDAEGNTLYIFKMDEAGKSNCAGTCAETWPPLKAAKPSAGEGVDESKIDTIEREDGTSQVTYDDQPLYTYSSDTKPGQTNGQGVGDNWYVIGPDGKAIEEK